MMLVVVNLLIANDLISVWSGAESDMILRSLTSSFFLPSDLLAFWSLEEGIWTFWWRLPSAVILISAMVAFYFGARKLFGQSYSQYALLALGASFFIVHTSKLASSDAWAFSTQWMSWLILLLFLKQPTLQWRLLFYALLGLAVWIQPLETILFISLNTVGLYFFHPQRRSLIQLNPVAGLLGPALLFYLTGVLDWKSETAYWSIASSGYLKFIGVSLLGWLPFLGFVLGGIREMVNKWKRKEELTIVLGVGMISAVIGHAIVFHGILAMIVGRQMIMYFNERFPYRAFVKTGAILHLVAAFTVAVVLTIYNFLEFRAAGFRSSLAVTTGYWMPAFMAVIGLYGINKRYVVVGTIWGGLLATFLFYVQFMPLIENRRGVVKTAIERAAELSNYDDELLLWKQKPEQAFDQERVYGKASFSEVNIVEEKNRTGLYLHKEEWPQDSSYLFHRENDRLIGWDDDLDIVKYTITK